MAAQEKIALVTGASSGFGRLAAEKLAGAGFRVFGTSRKQDETHPNAEMLTLDVTSGDSVNACVNTVIEKAGRIDLLVNNAGSSHLSLIEETPLYLAEKIFQVNFWGTVRMTQAVLPHMRKQKSGCIINLSSLAGMVATPGQGMYGASKFALEGYTETLCAELGPLPIEVALIEPGFFRTGFKDAMARESEPISDYDSFRGEVEKNVLNGFDEGGEPEIVADTIVDIATKGTNDLRHLIGKNAKKIVRLKKWLPQKWMMDGIRKTFGIPAE